MICCTYAPVDWTKPSGVPLTWDYLRAYPDKVRRHDFALVTCPNGHTLRAVATVHGIDADGRLSPSWVCVKQGCTFHAFVQLVGWGGGAMSRPRL